MHAWPVLRYFVTITPPTAVSRSASSKTGTAALSPSSIDVRFSVSAHWASSSRPISVEPVKRMWRTSGLPVSSGPISGVAPTTTLSTPAGSPARSASSAKASAVSGVCSAVFTTIVRLASSAGPTLRVVIAAGKFHGVIAAHTPSGSLSTTTRPDGPGPSKMSPRPRLASSASHSTNEAA